MFFLINLDLCIIKKKYSYRFVSLQVSVHHRHQLQKTEKLTVCYWVLLLPPSQNRFLSTKQRDELLRATTDWAQTLTQREIEWLTKHRLYRNITRNKTRNEGREFGTWIRNSSCKRRALNIELLCNTKSLVPFKGMWWNLWGCITELRQ